MKTFPNESKDKIKEKKIVEINTFPSPKEKSEKKKKKSKKKKKKSKNFFNDL